MKPLNVIKERKGLLFRNLVLVSLLSIGISLLANFFSNKYNANSILLWIGVSLIFIVILVYLVIFYKSKEYTIKEESLFITDKKGFFLPINRFRLSEDMHSSLSSVFKENNTFKEKWENAFKENEIKNKEEFKKMHISNNEDIIGFFGELVEYIFLKKLSVITVDYFNTKSNEIEVLTRDKISDYVLQNRILEMISKPFEERSAFSNNKSDTKDSGTIYAMFANGVVYERFELLLPKGTSLSKDKKNNTLIIKNRNYSICFKHGFSGFSSSTPRGFEKYYLNKGFDEINHYSFTPKLKIKLNPFFFLFFSNWKNMNWIDIICEEFSNYFSFDKFIEKIGYEYALTNIIINENCKKSERNNDATNQVQRKLIDYRKNDEITHGKSAPAFDNHEQQIIELLAKNSSIEEGELGKSLGISLVYLRKMLNSLQEKRVISCRMIGGKKYWIMLDRNDHRKTYGQIWNEKCD